MAGAADLGMKRHSHSMMQYVVCLGAFLSNLSAGMFNVALVDISSDFHQSVSSAQWVITIYLLTVSISLPFMGRLGDIRGKQTIHNSGYLLFAIGALCCALSPNLPILLAFRVLQGIGAAMYQATNMALIVTLFPQEHRGRALGIASTFVAAGAMVGPSLGGIVVQWFSWHMNFWLLFAISSVAWVLAQRYVPKDQPSENTGIDRFGAALFGGGLGSLMTALSFINSGGDYTMLVIGLFGIFVVSAGLFAWWSLSPRWNGSLMRPFIELGIFRAPGVRLGIVITIVTYLAAFSAQLVLPLYLRSSLHLEPALAGLILVAYPVSLIFAAPLSGDFSDRFGSTPIMSFGLMLMIGALSGLSFITPYSSLAYVVIFIVLLGCSMGMITSPNNSIVMSRAPKPALGLISSMIALCRNLGMMFGAVSGSLLMGISGKEELLARQATGDSGASGYRIVFMATALLVCAVTALLLVSTLRSGKKQPIPSSVHNG